MVKFTSREIENMSAEEAEKLKLHSQDNGSFYITLWHISQKIKAMQSHLKKFKNDKANGHRFRDLLMRRRRSLRRLEKRQKAGC